MRVHGSHGSSTLVAPDTPVAYRSGLRVPVSTYRLQFNHAFPFRAAQELVGYLHTLGITDCYTSSYLKATPGSMHGYDVADPTELNPELGSEDDYRAFVTALRDAGMGHLLDVVPNHMGIAQSCNAWWLDVLEHGPGSVYAKFFDIEWRPVKRELENKILLPVLSDLYGLVLEHQEITLGYENGAFFVRCNDARLPIAPQSASRILTHRLDALVEQEGGDSVHVQELQSIVTALHHLPPRGDRDPRKVEERYRENQVIKRRLATLVRQSAAVRRFIEDNLTIFNGRKGDPASFDLLDELLNDQVYRLAFWRVASEEINYRRFFDINELAAVRMEDDAVFQTSHQLIFKLLKDGAVTGLRIDHVDGLYDPGRYLRRLQDWARTELPQTDSNTDSERPLFVVVEKILGPDEPLNETWPIHGTTGYDFANLVNGLFVDQAHARRFDEIYAKFIRRRIAFADLAYEKKKLIMSASMSSEINALGHQLNTLSERDRRTRDFTLNSLINTIREIIACFPVYRTYVTADLADVDERDRRYIRQAVAQAKRRNPAVSALAFDFVQDLLLKRLDERATPDLAERLRFVMRFQQTTSPVTAKGIEDTALYIYNRLVSLNEVGGNPEQFGIAVATFHERMLERQARWPWSLSATSTHDTKRSEDVRARLNVISEFPGEWKTAVSRWSKQNKRFKTELDGHFVPDRNEEYLLYQTLIGAWPLSGPEGLSDAAYREFTDRIQAYISKALHEAKIHTSWVEPNQAYDLAVQKFIEAVLDRTRPNPFLDSLRSFQETVAQYGMWTSLAQVLVKLTAPGVPDLYQGTELWDFSLVDPDNRRPVDYSVRRRYADELDARLRDGELGDLWRDVIES
ncbi:MAG TPA: malto-oligosyltrehalose synthase, partial [Nitrospirales bacterium]|nr:malto-oligosyltrehalose synthase [Nitrospirales bacterium]